MTKDTTWEASLVVGPQALQGLQKILIVITLAEWLQQEPPGLAWPRFFDAGAREAETDMMTLIHRIQMKNILRMSLIMGVGARSFFN